MTAVLVIGSGGREHAIAWKLARSPHVTQIYVAPGNGGTSWAATDGIAPCESVDIVASDFHAVARFAREHSIELTVIGPEIPLADGIVDYLQDAGLRVFGPVRNAAQIEASKAFSKDFMVQQSIPTGEYFVTDNETVARRYLDEYRQPVVVKASGLAAGKGVIICDTREEAGDAIHAMLSDHAFGTAGDVVVIEEKLTGREISVLAFCDGKTVKPMITARDHKRANNGDTGPNTGGMGAVAPSPDISPELIQEVTGRVLQPAVDGMAALGTPYVGVLYAGLMLTDKGIKTLEFNCRFGDPETQVVLPLLKSDLYEIFNACIDGKLNETDIEWHNAAAATIVLASGGYPANYKTGYPIHGLNDIVRLRDVTIFHAGTQRSDNGHIVTSGGRVLAVTGTSTDLTTAIDRAYTVVEQINFKEMHYRKDIGRTKLQTAGDET